MATRLSRMGEETVGSVYGEWPSDVEYKGLGYGDKHVGSVGMYVMMYGVWDGDGDKASIDGAWECMRLEISWSNPSWNNRSCTGNLKLRRLDRALVNEEWLQVFPTSYVQYKNPGLSDHSPIIVLTSPVHNTGGKPFKFHNMWLSDTSLYEVVERAWNSKIRGNPIFIIFKKLQGTKRAIKYWNRNSFRRVDILAPQIRKTLDEIQTKVAVDPRNSCLRDEEKAIREKFIRIAKQEESLFHQNSRVNWLNLGDSNTEFFHSAKSMRRNQNQIQAIEDQNGEFCTEPQGIADILVNHFSCLLNHNISMIGDLPEPQYKLSSYEAHDLVKPFGAKEIKDVVFNCDGNLAPGPDGFNGAFFKQF
ncbi:uncharacterized protein LOC143888562 [Tasmannia lanceolata]|uniref:uncharacterized protein LOC143888562 n=1 Tax=Tasmannia lanceolata TaxID=3420 RepID=UPI00406338AD